jgi:hypothetical protein
VPNISHKYISTSFLFSMYNYMHTITFIHEHNFIHALHNSFYLDFHPKDWFHFNVINFHWTMENYTFFSIPQWTKFHSFDTFDSYTLLLIQGYVSSLSPNFIYWTNFYFLLLLPFLNNFQFPPIDFSLELSSMASSIFSFPISNNPIGSPFLDDWFNFIFVQIFFHLKFEWLCVNHYLYPLKNTLHWKITYMFLEEYFHLELEGYVS